MKVCSMTTECESDIDDENLNEMLYITCMYRDSGFKTVACDADVQIEILKELVRLREEFRICKVKSALAAGK